MICYLCGKEILKTEKESVDHVPARQIFPKEIRRKFNLDRLVTLPAHLSCNQSYQLDEDYFTCAFAGFATETFSGQALWNDVRRRLSKSDQPLREKILGEFSEQSPGGIYAPPGKTFKAYDGARTGNVIWKIVRGLFFNDTKRYLPTDTPRRIIIVPPGEEPPAKEFAHVRDTAPKGRYGKVFEYKVFEFNSKDPACHAHSYALLLWDKIIFICHFHDPDCICSKCSEVGGSGIAS